MFLSKSFGYALRGILYIALENNRQRKVQVGEIAGKLSVPRHFLAKVLKQVVKNGILESTKGPYGGFSVSVRTMDTSLIHLFEVTDGKLEFNECVLGGRKCNSKNPCPLHDQMVLLRNSMLNNFSNTCIGDLLEGRGAEFINSISAN